MPVSTSLFDLTGQVALVTGGGSGIGKACAEALIKHGAKVVPGGRTLDKVESAAQELDAIGDKSGVEPVAAAVQLDVASDESAAHAVKKTIDLFGGLNIVINSAGVMCKKPTFDLTAEDMNSLYNIHVTGALRVSPSSASVWRGKSFALTVTIPSACPAIAAAST